MKRHQARNADESCFPSPKPLNQGRFDGVPPKRRDGGTVRHTGATRRKGGQASPTGRVLVTNRYSHSHVSR
jgi:hypothetical protein